MRRPSPSFFSGAALRLGTPSLAASALTAAALALALASDPAAAHTRYTFNGTLVLPPGPLSAAGQVQLQAAPAPGDAVSGWFELPTSGDYGYASGPDDQGASKTLYWEIDYPMAPETTLVDWSLSLPTTQARMKGLYGYPSSSLRRTLHVDGTSSLEIETFFMGGGEASHIQAFKLTYLATDGSLYGDLSTPLNLSKVSRAWGSYGYDIYLGNDLTSVKYDFELSLGATPVPEPSAWWLVAAGVPLAAWTRRRLGRASH